jgi:hypothetical protein
MTIKCLKLDDNHDLALEGGRLVFLTGLDALRQIVKVTFLAHAGEWMLDTGFGVQYRGRILVKNPDFGLITAHLRTVAIGIDGVDAVKTLQLQHDPETRELTVNMELDPIGALKVVL